MWNWLAQDIGIDLGTANTLVYVKGKGIVAQEPSVVAMDDKRNVLAVGTAAKLMLGRTPGHITAYRPMKDGVIADFDITLAMLQHFLGKHSGRRGPFRPRCVIGVPGGVTGVEKRAIQDATLQAGAREVYVLEEPLAAAIGAGLPVSESVGSMVVDVGGGTTDAAVISLGGIVARRSVRMAGDVMDEAIVQWLRRKHNLLIGPRTAEAIKLEIGAACDPDPKATAEARGRDMFGGMPRTVTVRADEIGDALREPVRAICDATLQTLEATPPELAADIIERGIWLTGGGALLHGLDRLLARETGVAVYLAEEPLLCVVRGTAQVLEDVNVLRKVARSA